MSDFDLLKDTPELTAAIKRDRERIMTESEQAQAVAEIRELSQLSAELGNDSPWTLRCKKLLEIVDSQAQKIAEARQAAESIRARYTARIAGDSQARHYARADLLFPWEKP